MFCIKGGEAMRKKLAAAMRIEGEFHLLILSIGLELSRSLQSSKADFLCIMVMPYVCVSANMPDALQYRGSPNNIQKDFNFFNFYFYFTITVTLHRNSCTVYQTEFNCRNHKTWLIQSKFVIIAIIISWTLKFRQNTASDGQISDQRRIKTVQ